MTEQVTLKFDIPKGNEPGWLRRERQAQEFRRILDNEQSPEQIDDIVDFLSQFVTEPEDETKKKEALWMATRDEISRMVDALLGQSDANPTE